MIRDHHIGGEVGLTKRKTLRILGYLIFLRMIITKKSTVLRKIMGVGPGLALVQMRIKIKKKKKSRLIRKSLVLFHQEFWLSSATKSMALL